MKLNILANKGTANQAKAEDRTSLQTASLYTQAISSGDIKSMKALYAENFTLDFVARDAFEGNELSIEEAAQFWVSWFEAFPDRDYQVTRSVVAEEIVVTQWIFIGTNTGPLMPLIFDEQQAGTGKTVRFRGVSVYDIKDGFLERETTYLDLGTLLVELGATI